ncbi:hypothetical protein E4Z66_09550 [Aliishimia ponticola]|uniref:Uncharacterized protein n=1 Tax=Aliishimia ponticola TaxID=2499833 RepID=A0A4S4NCK4_9RHOB|nr:hypothetical protein [Aliishimia ponticola]THH37162.1 hypothetical protein E4Z66_09550 [Aliishimia ponticola]
MMRALILVALLAIAAGALFATSPNRAMFEAQVEEQIVAQIEAMDPNDAEDEATRLLLTGCKFGASGCARLVRSLMDIRWEDRVLYSTATLRLGQGDPLRCYGLLNKIICPGL